jgi:tetratricopeptide (TPR) repeat protein/DNA-binding XRE family transcriptional regulator
MDKDNKLLKSARLRKCWTPKFVSEQVGVSRNTYMRWESGAQIPRPTSLGALCEIFNMSPAELGFVKDVQVVSSSSVIRSVNVESESMMISEDDRYGVNDYGTQNLSELLATWSMGMASCWQWYMAGGQRELECLVPTYITRLTGPTLTPGPEQHRAASLISQVYQLIALLDLQREDLGAALANGTQALIYSQLAQDWNMYVAAQIRLAQIYTAYKRIGSALGAYNDALRCVNTDNRVVSPLLHSWIFAGLAEIQALMGRETEALQFLKLAVAVFPEKPETADCISYTWCDRSMLYQYQGLVFLRLGQLWQAWQAFALVDELKPPPPERVRTDFLRYRAYTSIMLGNMVQSCIYLEAAARASQAINSDLMLSEIYILYEHMLAIWGQESRVRSLATLFKI